MNNVITIFPVYRYTFHTQVGNKVTHAFW